MVACFWLSCMIMQFMPVGFQFPGNYILKQLM